MFQSLPRAAFITVVVLCLALGAGGASAVQADSGVPDPQVETPTADNETQQENPESVEDGEYDRETAAWLAQTMGAQLENSSIALSEGEYERAQSFLGEDYDSRLEQYVEVAGDTAGEGDDATAAEFKAARRTQRTLTAEVQRYRQQHAAYREARENGNERRARTIATRMERTASNITDSSRRLNRNFATIENATAVDLSEGQAEINETRANVTATQAEIREAVLVGTTLTAETADSTASFTDPGLVTGQIQTENGSVVANRDVTLTIANRTRTVRTDSNGAFETWYRPRSTRVGQQSVEVAYVPNAGTAYLADNDTFTVDVQQVTADVSTEFAPKTVAYGTRFNMSGTVTAGSNGVDGVPVEFVVANTVVARATTGPNGTAVAPVQFPASVDSGDQQVVARLPRDWAVTGTSPGSPIAVTETPVNLSVTAANDADGVRASGTLRTADGDPVAGRPVRLQVGDDAVRTVETAGDGSFQVVLDAPSANDSSPTVTARYAEPESNLGNATAQASLAGGGGGAGPPVSSGSDRDILVESILAILFGKDGDGIGFGGAGLSYDLLILLGGLVALAVVVVSWFVVSRFKESSDAQPTAPDATADLSVVGPGSDADDDDTDRLFDERAEAYLDSGAYDAAAILAYDAVHEQLTVENGLPESTTHWELLRQTHEDDRSAEEVAAIETVVETFERAAFAPASVDPDRAEAAVERARAIKSNGDGPADRSPS